MLKRRSTRMRILPKKEKEPRKSRKREAASRHPRKNPRSPRRRRIVLSKKAGKEGEKFE